MLGQKVQNRPHAIGDRRSDRSNPTLAKLVNRIGVRRLRRIQGDQRQVRARQQMKGQIGVVGVDRQGQRRVPEVCFCVRIAERRKNSSSVKVLDKKRIQQRSETGGRVVQKGAGENRRHALAQGVFVALEQRGPKQWVVLFGGNFGARIRFGGLSGGHGVGRAG